jgi:hypothetical protein
MANRSTRLPRAKAEYIERRLRNEQVPAKELAAKYGLAHKTVSNQTSFWEKDVLHRIEQRNAMLREEIARSHQQAIDTMRQSFTLDVEEIFSRQLKMYRDLANAGYFRLVEISKSKELLDPDLAKELWRIGLNGEMKLVASAMDMLVAAKSGSARSPQEQQDHQKKMRVLAECLSDYLSGENKEPIRGRLVQVGIASDD